jgi:hypothetical protein
MSATSVKPALDYDAIARKAFELYRQREEQALNDWYRAERSLLSQMQNPQPVRRISQQTIADQAYKNWQSRVDAVNGSAECDWDRAIDELVKSNG